MIQEEFRQTPSIVEARVKSYKTLWKLFIAIHYSVGITGLCASILASSLQEPLNRIFALLAAISFGIVAFVKPEQQYFKYVRAWRFLDNGIIKYRLKLEEETELIKKLDQAESILYEFEEKRIQNGTDQSEIK